MLELKIVDLTSSVYFLIYFILDLGLGFSMILYLTITCYGHTITCHKEHHKRFWNNNIILYVLYIDLKTNTYPLNKLDLV